MIKKWKKSYKNAALCIVVIQSWISLLVVQEQLVIWLILAKKVCCYKMVQNRSEAINLYFPQITLLEHYSKNKWTFPAYVFCMCLYVSWCDKSLLKAHSYLITPKFIFKKYLCFIWKFCILFSKKLIEMESHIFVRWVFSNS